MKIKLNTPINNNTVSSLNLLDIVSLNGLVLTARDEAHKYIYENFILQEPDTENIDLYKFLIKNLNGGVIYHCGPIMKKEKEHYKIISAGPTTSIREEKYTDEIIKKFNVKAIIGKGGMGNSTLSALKENKSVYLHAIGGCGVKIAGSITEVIDVKMLEFGIPEAIWLIKVKDFVSYVTMDSKGNSAHNSIYNTSVTKSKMIDFNNANK